MSTATATLPTQDQLREYAEQMPQVYKDILIALRAADPYRRVGKGVLRGTLLNTMRSRMGSGSGSGGSPYGSGMPVHAYTHMGSIPVQGSAPLAIRGDTMTDDEYAEALMQLHDLGFIRNTTETVYGTVIPTELGEELFTVVTGAAASKIRLPDLPKHNW